MTKAKIAQKAPYKVSVEAGKKYFWCSCGYSKNQPFCDGNHKEHAPDFRAIAWQSSESKEIYFCGCKQAKNGTIFCDGSHSKL
ncbi:MAG: CDGSH iron-sulfur domain-containing protein [Rickettsiales bacterium]